MLRWLVPRSAEWGDLKQSTRYGDAEYSPMERVYLGRIAADAADHDAAMTCIMRPSCIF